MAAGASDAAEILHAARRIVGGNSYVSPLLAAHVPGRDCSPTRLSQLWPRRVVRSGSREGRSWVHATWRGG